MMRNLGRLSAEILAAITAFLLGIMVASPAFAWTYSRSRVASYSDRYSCNGTTACRNSAYYAFSNDCTSFVSQAQRAGGLPFDVAAPYAYWHYYALSDYTNSWSVVASFKSYMVDKAAHASLLSVTMSAKYSPASKGDVYMYDWGKGAGYSHLSVSPGFGTFANFYDSGNRKNYTSVTSGSGDWLNQHSGDRYHAPWNWGYWIESDPVVRSKMRTVVIHYKY